MREYDTFLFWADPCVLGFVSPGVFRAKPHDLDSCSVGCQFTISTRLHKTDNPVIMLHRIVRALECQHPGGSGGLSEHSGYFIQRTSNIHQLRWMLPLAAPGNAYPSLLGNAHPSFQHPVIQTPAIGSHLRIIDV